MDFSDVQKKIKSIEKEITKGIIRWKIKKMGREMPDEVTLDKGSERIVEESHNILKNRSKSFLDELRQAKAEFLKAYRDEDGES